MEHKHKVVRTYDGVYEPTMGDDLFEGRYDECVSHIRFMSDHDYNMMTRGKWDIGIINCEYGRFVSYVI